MEMNSTEGAERVGVKARLHKFQNGQWVEVLTGEVSFNHDQLQLEVIIGFTQLQYNQHKLSLPVEFPQPYGSSPMTLTLPLAKIREVQIDSKDKTVMYFWVGIDPISLSFLNEQSCQAMLRSLSNEQCEDLNNLRQDDEISLQYIKHCLEGNPAMLSILFSNNKSQVLDFTFQSIREVLDLGLEITQSEKDMFFNIMKNAIKLGDKPRIEKMTTKTNFQLLLKALRYNPFNDADFDYCQIFNQVSAYHNVMAIQDESLLDAYEQNARIRYLKDCVACMFIQIDTERILNNMINENNIYILQKMGGEPELINSLYLLSVSSPQAFLNTCVELWEIYKFLNTDRDTQWIKDEFRKNFVQKGLHKQMLHAAESLAFGTIPIAEDRVPAGRFHEKWIQSLNPFISSDWTFSQQWLCQASDHRSLFKILLQILSTNKDQGTLQCVLNFVRQLIEPSENRYPIQPRFLCMIYTDFVGGLWKEMKGDWWLVQQYLEFMMKIYKVQSIRTRRALIQSGALLLVDKNFAKKSILISAIKVLQCFLEGDNLDVFRYLLNNCLFRGLKAEYSRNANVSNMINSCFRSLIRTYRMVNIDQVTQNYFAEVFFPEESKSSTPPEGVSPSELEQNERIVV